MKFIQLFLSVLFFSHFSYATNYYVSNAGNDSNTGTSIESPWQTITKVSTINFQPGDKLLFKGGESFLGSIYLNSSDGNNSSNIFTISSYGEGRATINAGNSYGIFGYNTQGIRIENLILNGFGINTNNQDGLSFYADLPGNIKLKGLSFENIEVKNFGKTGVKIGSWNGNTGYENLSLNKLEVHNNSWDGILVYGFIGYNNYMGYPHKNVTITNCISYNNSGIADPNAIRGNGIVLSNTDGGLIENCKAFQNGENNVHCGGPGGIWVYDAKGIIIQYNESYSNRSSSKCDGLGFDLDGGSINCIMQYNYSHDNDGGGYLMGQMENGRPWKNNVCRYNISQNDGRHNAAAITLFKEGTFTIMDSCFVYNNTIYLEPAPNNDGEAACKITQWYTGMTNVKFYNNIFITKGGIQLIDVPEGYFGSFAGNLYWSTEGTFLINYQGKNYSSLSAWRTATGNEMVNNFITGKNDDPFISQIGLGGTLNPRPTSSLTAYQLLPGSPAIDAGLDLSVLFNLPASTRDFWGKPSLSGSAFDIGADEKLIVSRSNNTQQQNAEISIFPNPTTGMLLIEGTGLMKKIEIFSPNGIQLKSLPVNDKRAVMDCTGISKGIYILHFFLQDHIQTNKIIIH